MTSLQAYCDATQQVPTNVRSRRVLDACSSASSKRDCGDGVRRSYDALGPLAYF